jgi:hypothetical protein
MNYWIPIEFIVAAGFAVAELSGGVVHQLPVLADAPVTYYRFGEAPGCVIAVDASIDACDWVYRGTPIDDIQVDERILDQTELGAGDSYGLAISTSEAKLSGSTYMVGAAGGLGQGFPFIDEVLGTSGAYASSSSYVRAARTGAGSKAPFESRGMLREMAIHRYARMPAHAKSHYLAETPFEILTFLGLGLILCGFIPRWFGNAPKFCGFDAGLSHARIFRAGGVKLRKRSETELNSFSACYATIAVQKKPPLSQYAAPVAFRRPRPG